MVKERCHYPRESAGKRDIRSFDGGGRKSTLSLHCICPSGTLIVAIVDVILDGIIYFLWQQEPSGQHGVHPLLFLSVFGLTVN